MTTAPRYTAAGGPAVETEARRIMAEIAEVTRRTVPGWALRALVLLGGYGRGEGGVEYRDGRERLHNNLDLLLVLNGRGTRERAAARDALARALGPVAEEAGVGIDLGAIGAAQLQRAPCLVMWYDMRFGHRTLAGDRDFVPGLTRFRVDRIIPSDVRNLLVNRATLLVLNDFLLEAAPADDAVRRSVVRHAMKAIIGYGDALLFANGAYHWSYREKRRRIATSPAGSGFRALYDAASAFRFRPEYGPWLGRDLGAWMEELRTVLEPIHRRCEASRLAVPLDDWSSYWASALRRASLADLTVRDVARRTRDLLRRTAERVGAGVPRTTRTWWQWVGVRDLLPLVAPVVLYRLPLAADRARAATVLRAAGTDDRTLRDAYLRRWGTVGDPNFAAVLDRFAVTLDSQEAA